MIRVLPLPIRDAALLIARVLLGVVLIAHGWQKLVTDGLGAVAADFGEMGIPLPAVAAGYATVVELAGGVLLVAGACTAVVGLLVVVDMVGAAFFVHIGNGLFAREGGWELVGVIAALALALAAAGAGRYSVDHVLSTRTRQSARA